jgi:polynucleotide 5'-kinase involved in rRNA processing
VQNKLIQLDRKLQPILWPPPVDATKSAEFQVSDAGRPCGWQKALSETAALVVGSANSGKTSEFRLLVDELRNRG